MVTADQSIDLLGIGCYLPPTVPYRQLLTAARRKEDEATADPPSGRGATSVAKLRAWLTDNDSKLWDCVRIGTKEDQPSVMGAKAVQHALEAADISVEQLSLVVSTATTADYHPWSMAAEIMRVVRAPEHCLGIDVPHACLGIITSLELARSWLAANGGGYAAVVNSESWGHARPSFLQLAANDPSMNSLLFWGDGASAVIVSSERPGKAMAHYRGACFQSLSQLSKQWIFPYGGTSNPEPPPGEALHGMRVSTELSREAMIEMQTKAFLRLGDKARSRFGVHPDRLVCLQVSPTYVHDTRRLFGLEPEDVALTGDRNGHMSASDILLGIDHLHRHDLLKGAVFMVADAVVTGGIGLLEAP